MIFSLVGKGWAKQPQEQPGRWAYNIDCSCNSFMHHRYNGIKNKSRAVDNLASDSNSDFLILLAHRTVRQNFALTRNFHAVQLLGEELLSFSPLRKRHAVVKKYCIFTYESIYFFANCNTRYISCRNICG